MNSSKKLLVQTVHVLSDTPSLNHKTGAITVKGGIGVKGDLNVGGDITCNGKINLGTECCKPDEINIYANISSNLIPSKNSKYTLGNYNNMWKDLFVSDNCILNNMECHEIKVINMNANNNYSNKQIIKNNLDFFNTAKISGNMIPYDNNDYNIGNTDFKWKNIYSSGKIITTLVESNQIKINNKNSNSIITDGGILIGKDLHVKGNIILDGEIK